MIKWFKSLSRQEKIMALLIVLLLIGVILRWDTIRQKAGIWFRADEIMQERSDSVTNVTAEEPADSTAREEGIYLP